MEIYDSMQKFDDKELIACVSKYCNLEDKQAIYLCWLANQIGKMEGIHLKMK